MAACFVNDLGTVIALGLLFTSFGKWFWIFLAITVFALLLLPKITPVYLRWVGAHASEPEVKYIYLVLLVLGYFASRGGSEGVLPAYLVGMMLADTFLANRDLIKRMRATTFALLTPFYFLRAGSLVDLKLIFLSIGVVVLLFFAKTIAKMLGLYPAGLLFGFSKKHNLYTTLLMSTGLTFGTISALYGLTNGIISRGQYSTLVFVVILTAIIPTLIAQTFFEPKGGERESWLTTEGGKDHV